MITLSEAQQTDIPIIQKLADSTWRVAYHEILSTDQMNYMLDRFYSLRSLQEQMQERQQFFIAREEEVPVGFASWSFTEPVKHVAKLQKLYVLPDYQGKNIGKQLLLRVTEEAKKQNAKILLLNVNRYNKARLFYERCGFKVIKEEDVDIGQGYFMNDYQMQLSLE